MRDSFPVLEFDRGEFGKVRRWPRRMQTTHRQGDTVRGEPGVIARYGVRRVSACSSETRLAWATVTGYEPIIAGAGLGFFWWSIQGPLRYPERAFRGLSSSHTVGGSGTNGWGRSPCPLTMPEWASFPQRGASNCSVRPAHMSCASDNGGTGVRRLTSALQKAVACSSRLMSPIAGTW